MLENGRATAVGGGVETGSPLKAWAGVGELLTGLAGGSWKSFQVRPGSEATITWLS